MTTNAQKFVARGLAMKGRPRKTIWIEPSEYAFLDEPVYTKRYGKSESNGGRICSLEFCRIFVADKDAACPECGSIP